MQYSKMKHSNYHNYVYDGDRFGRICSEYGIINWEDGHQIITDDKKELKKYRRQFQCYIRNLDAILGFLFKEAILLEQQMEILRQTITEADYDLYRSPTGKKELKKYRDCLSHRKIIYNHIVKCTEDAKEHSVEQFICKMFDRLHMMILDIPSVTPDYT